MSNLTQGSTEWHAWRAEGVGASEIAAVMGISPWTTARQVWLEKTGQSERPPVNAAMMRGTELEDDARQAFTDDSGVVVSVTDSCLEHPKHPFIRASLDGDVDDTTIIEIKCPGDKQYEAMKEGVPEYYRAQIQQQLLVTGKGKCVFWVWHPDHGGYSHDVEADTDFQERIIEAATEFWQRVEMHHWPSDGLDDLIADMADAKRVQNCATDAVKQAEAALMDAMKDKGLRKAEDSLGAKVAVVCRKVVDNEWCSTDADWNACKEKESDAAKIRKEIEKKHMVDGSVYIRLTMPK